MTATHLNLEVIQDLQDLLGDGFSILIDRFCSDAKRRLDLLIEGVATFNFITIHEEAHGIKGSCRNIGADQLASLCAELEDRGRENNADNIEQILAAIEQEFAVLTGLLSEYI